MFVLRDDKDKMNYCFECMKLVIKTKNDPDLRNNSQCVGRCEYLG